MRILGMTIVCCMVVFFSCTDVATGDNAREEKEAKNSQIGVYNEWGRLREAFIGQEDQTVEPEYVPALKWVKSVWDIENLHKYGGRKTSDVLPELSKQIQQQLNTMASILKAEGVIVHRTQPVPYPEELSFLDNIQKGNMLFGGAGYVRVIGNTVLLMNSFRLPFRRKQVWMVRRVLEPLLKDRDVRYCASPPPSPHHLEHDIYIENGDIMLDGFNVYVGLSGNATSEEGAEWLQQFLGQEFKVYTIPLKSDLFHLDWVLSLNKPGLMTYCPEALIEKLPEPLLSWDKIEITLDEARTAGANNLSISPDTIIVSSQHERIAKEYEKKGMRVIRISVPTTIVYGSGPRCLTGVLSRDH
ncbi:hypothetical protein KKC91_09785 [bacterium]|nr:hypothetical protein [bacterium]